MKRNKKPMKPMEPMKPFKQQQIITHPFGGFLPNPPDNCSKSEFTFNHNGINWLDLSICHNCGAIKKCKDRKIYLINLKKERKENEI